VTLPGLILLFIFLILKVGNLSGVSLAVFGSALPFFLIGIGCFSGLQQYA
jgi:hypothetical protein